MRCLLGFIVSAFCARVSLLGEEGYTHTCFADCILVSQLEQSPNSKQGFVEHLQQIIRWQLVSSETEGMAFLHLAKDTYASNIFA